MKYSTKEVCFFGINSSDTMRRARAERQGQLNYRYYKRQLSRVLQKMAPRYRAFFEDKSQLHDSNVHQIVFGSTHYARKDQHKNKNYVELYVTHCQNGKVYVLRYLNIRKCIFDHPSTQIIYFERNKPLLMDWYTDELRITRDGWFIHEIIFSSGATLLIEFERFSYKTGKQDKECKRLSV